MKRRHFIRAFAAACVVPVVAAKAIASHKRSPRIMFRNNSSMLLKSIKGYEGTIVGYDQSGNGNHAFLKPEDDVWIYGTTQ